MKNKQKVKARLHCKYLVVACFFLLYGFAAQAQKVASSSGNWSSTATWGGATVPTATDAVTINSGITVTVNSAASCDSITFLATTNATSAIVVNPTFTLTVSGAVKLNSASGNNSSCSISGAGTLSCGSVQVGTDGTPDKKTTWTSIMTSTLSNFNISGALIVSSFRGRGDARLIQSSFKLESGVVNINGAVTTTNENAVNTSIFDMASGAQAGNLLLSNATPFNITATGTSTIRLNGTSTIVNYDGTVNQTARPSIYTNLTLSGSNQKTFATTPTVNGILSMEGTATVTVTGAGVVTYGPDATLQYNTTSSRTVTSEEWISPFAGTGGVVLANTGVITLNASKTINYNLTLTNGILATQITNTIAPATVSRTNGWVNGNLQLPVAIGSPTRNFYIGDGTRYTPVSLVFTGVTTAGSFKVSTSGSDHPNISTSTLNSALSANRYWTLVNIDNGTVFVSYNPTFTFVAGDLDAGASAMNFEGGLYSGSSWTYPALGLRTATSTQLTGVTGTGLFAVAEKKINVSFTTASQSSVGESGTMTITAQLSAVNGQIVSVPFTVAGTASGADYSITASPITIPVGSTTAFATITITGDAIDEANETVIVTMGTPINAAQGAVTTHTATITDDDAAPTISFTSSSQSSAGESGTLTITAQLSAASGQAVTVPFTVTGTATGGGIDYNISASPVTIAAGSITGAITISITADALDEPGETVVVTMGSPTHATASGTTVHTATITDDDAPPTIAFTVASQSSTNESGTLTITAQLSASSGFPVTLPFTSTGTATGGGTDYTISSSPVIIAAGATTAGITITIVNDALVEPNETVIVTMGTPINASIGVISEHTATVVDDDSSPPGSIFVNRQSPENQYDHAELVQKVLVQGCLTASNVVFLGEDTQIGHFTSGTSSFPISEGIILSTGKVADAEGPNQDYGTTTLYSGAGDADINSITGGTSYDAAVLEFDFIPAGNTIQFNYVFASEEYAEAVEASYNDAFAFLLSGYGITGTKNIALIPTTTIPVSINTVHGQGYQSVFDYPPELRAIVSTNSPFGHPFSTITDDANGYYGTSPNRYYYRIAPLPGSAGAENDSYYIDNGHFTDRIIYGSNGRRQLAYVNGSGGTDMEYDGRTTVLTATYNVTPCQTYHIKMVIADVYDGKWDSGVFLQGRSFTSDNIQISSFKDGLTGEANSMYEGCSGSYIRFQRITGADNSQAMTFPVILAGTAQNGVDFVHTDPAGTILGDGTFPASATIAAGQDFVDYYYRAQSDGIIEGNETAVFKVNTSCPCVVDPTYFEISVNIIDAPQIQASSVSVIRCESIGNPVATITVNIQTGLDPNNYEFRLDGGSFQLSNVFTIESTQPDGSDIVGSSHTLTIRDKYACNLVTENNVIIPPVTPSLASAGPDIAMCKGQAGIQLNASGGSYYTWTSSPPGGIDWLSGTTIPNPTVNSAIPAGVYTFTVTMQNEPGPTPACQGSDAMVLTVNQTPAVTISATDYDICNGTSIQLNASVTNGGVSPSYLWFPTADLSSAVISNPVYTPNVSSYLAQFFYVTVTASNGCSINAGAPRIEVFPSPLIVTGTIVNAACGGSNGSATVSASSPGTPTTPNIVFSYSWDAAAGDQTTATAVNLAAGIYTVTVTDVTHGCSNSKEVTVGAVIDVTPPTAVCRNVSVTLDGTGNATINPADINNGSTDNCTATGSLLLSLSKSAFDASNVGANTVVLTVTDAAGNSSTCSATVTVNYSATCNTSGSRTIYKEAFGTGSVDGGYTISGGSAYVPVAERMRVSTNTNTGNYFLSRSISISSYTNLNVSVSVPAQSELDAAQDYIQFWYSVNGAAFVQFANNGNMAGTWTGTSCTNVPNGTTLQIKILSYQDDASEWREFDNVHVTGNPAVEATAAITNVSCNGGNNGAINVTVTKGVLPYTYAWSTTGGSGLIATSEDQAGLTAGTYTLVVTDGNGVISDPFTFTVTQPAVDPVINTGLAVSDASSCNPAGSNVVFTITNAQNGIRYELKTTGGVSLSPVVTATGTGSNLNLTLLQPNVPIISTTYKVVATTTTGCTTSDLTDRPVLTVTTTPPPTGSSTQNFCSTSPHLVSNLVVTGTGIKWYLTASGGSAIPGTTNLVNGTTYYASQTGSGCESPLRLAVTAIVTTTPTILSVSHGIICGLGTVTLHATASSGTINWYNSQTLGTQLGAGNDFTTPVLSITTSYWVDATNTNCTTGNRSEVKANVFPVPTITLGDHPSVCVGAVTGNLPYSAITGQANQYSIIFDFEALSAGFANVPFTTLNASPIAIAIPGGAAADAYHASLTIKNNANSCSSNSYPITVTINPATAITSQSTSEQTRCIGGTFSPVSVAAIGGSLTYQWYSNTSQVASDGTSLGSARGAQTDTYWPPADVAGTLYYYCVVTGSCGSPVTSAVSGAFLVNPSTAITGQSTLTQTQCVGGTFSSISVTATGDGLSYQWYSNTNPVTSGGTALDPGNGAQTNTYTPQAVAAATLYYYCIVSGSCGSATSSISGAFVVNPVTAISSQSTDGQTQCMGETFAPITVSAAGVGLTYQWFRNTTDANTGGTSLGSGNGAQTSSYTPQTTVTGTLYYYCIVSGTCGSPVTSEISGAFLVNPVTGISSQSTSAQTQCVGGTFSSISVTAYGIGLSYQWYSNTSENTSDGISLDSGNGAQTNIYTPQTAAVGTLYYYCVVSGTCGTATSLISGAFLVNPGTAIANQSTGGQTRCIGGTFSSISVTATGLSLTYQWYSHTSPVNSGGTSLNSAHGAQTNTYTPQTSAAGTLYYYCIVIGTCGSATTAISGAFLVNPAPDATISGTITVCKDDAAPLITFTGTNGTDPYTFTYTINGGSPVIISTTSGNIATVQVPTSTTGSFLYTLTGVTDANTCSHASGGTATITVTPLVHTKKIRKL